MTKKYPPWIDISYDGHNYVVMSRDEHNSIMKGSIEGIINFLKNTSGKWIIHDNLLYVSLRELIEKSKPEEFGVKSEDVGKIEKEKD